MKDEIIEEVWKAKDAVALKYEYDVKALSEYLRQEEKKSSAKVVDLHAKRKASAGMNQQ